MIGRRIQPTRIGHSIWLLKPAPILSAWALVLIITGPGSASDNWTRINSFTYPWPPAKTPVEFTLELSDSHSGPGDYSRIRIQVPGHAEFSLSKSDGWVRLNSPPAAVEPELRKKNLFPNDFVLFLPVKGQSRVIAFLFGYSFTFRPGSLDAIELSPEGNPKQILHREAMQFSSMKDLDEDGTSEIIGNPCYGEVWGKDNAIETYVPAQVYKLSSLPGGEAQLSLKLSRMVNEKYRYGWAGPDCSNGVVVVHYPPGSKKVQIMKSSDAERLVNGDSTKEHN